MIQVCAAEAPAVTNYDLSGSDEVEGLGAPFAALPPLDGASRLIQRAGSEVAAV